MQNGAATCSPSGLIVLERGWCRTPTWGKTGAINTAVDKIANGSLPVPIKKALKGIASILRILVRGCTVCSQVWDWTAFYTLVSFA
eukprot:753167-Rhodomonas_salina.1